MTEKKKIEKKKTPAPTVKKTAGKASPKKKAQTKTVKKSTEKSAAKPVAKTSVKKTTKNSTRKTEYIPEIKKYYQENITKKLMERFKYESPMEVPKFTKITLNMGVGDGKENQKALDSAQNELTLISGQKSVITYAKKDVSNFKIRRGYPVGVRVTLRANKMYEFFQRLIAIALPRTRDFTGLSFKSFDGRGNYNFGVKEQIVFTEINYDKIDAIRGLDIAITTTAKSNDEGYWLLKEFGFPLREKPKKTKGAEVN